LEEDKKNLGRRIKSGNVQSLSLLYRQHWSQVFNVAYGLLKSREEAEEVVQDVFLKLWNYRENIRQDSQIEGLLFTIAKRETLNRLRTKASRYVFEEIEEGQSSAYVTDNQISDSELMDISQNTINSLPDKRRQIVNMRWHKGLTNKEIARELGVSIKFVEKQIALARQSLYEQIKVNGFHSILLFMIIMI